MGIPEKNKRVPCPECGKKMLKGNIKRHQNVIHGQERSIHHNKHTEAEPRQEMNRLSGEQKLNTQCPICSKNFSNKHHLKRHVINVHKVEDYTINSVESLEPDVPQESECGQKSFPCPICGSYFTRKYTVKTHCIRMHNSSPCFPLAAYLSKNSPPHLASVIGSKTESLCSQQEESSVPLQEPPVCNFETAHDPGESTAMRRPSEHLERPRPRRKTRGRYSNYEVVSVMQCVRDGIRRKSHRRYKCPHCSHNFFTLRGYSKHSCIANAISDLPHNPFVPIRHPFLAGFKCSLCGVCLKSLRSFNNHAYMHAGLAPYKCTICKKMFSSDTKMRKHISRVHGPRHRPQVSRKRVTMSCVLLEADKDGEPLSIEGLDTSGKFRFLYDSSEFLHNAPPSSISHQHFYVVSPFASSSSPLPQSNSSSQLSILPVGESIPLVSNNVLDLDYNEPCSNNQSGDELEHHLLEIEEEKQMSSVLLQFSDPDMIEEILDTDSDILTVEENKEKEVDERKGNVQNESVDLRELKFVVEDEIEEEEMELGGVGDSVRLNVPVDVQVIDKGPFSNPHVVRKKYGTWDLVIF